MCHVGCVIEDVSALLTFFSGLAQKDCGPSKVLFDAVYGRETKKCADENQMSFLTILPWVLIVALLSVLGMIYGVSHEAVAMSYWAAAAFALFIVFVGYLSNRKYWRRLDGLATRYQSNIAAARNARLFGVSYLWGAVVLMAIYSLTQLHWRHGWQYALGMALLALISFIFAGLLEREDKGSRTQVQNLARILTIVQGVSAALGLIYLVGSGKMSSVRMDWAANHVFLFGGIAIVLLSVFSLRTDKILGDT